LSVPESGAGGQPVRIAFVQKNFHPNNVGIIAGLHDRGHDVVPIVQYPGGAKSASATLALDPVVVPYQPSSLRRYRADRKRLDRRGLPHVRQLFRELRAFRPDVVLVKEVRGVSLIAVQIARLLGAKTVLLWDKPLTARKRPLLAVLGPLLLPRRKIHTAYFGDLGARVPMGGLIGPSLLLSFPVLPGPPIEPGWQEEDAKVRIVSIGSLTNRVKRFDWVVDAIGVSGLADRVDVTFIGLGNEQSAAVRAIREREQAHGLRPSTILYDVPHPEVLRLLPTFDVLAHPALRGMADVVIAEAMTNGVVPLCSERCGTHVCFVDGVSGRLFRSDSFEEFAERLTELVTNGTLRRSMAREAHVRAHEHLSPSAWALQFERLVATERRRSPRRSRPEPLSA
jgi:glycosyltransferase involved in cell wall biosynthesis